MSNQKFFNRSIYVCFILMLFYFRGNAQEECKVSDFNYDSLETFVVQILERSKELALDKDGRINPLQIRNTILNDTISNKTLSTENLWNIIRNIGRENAMMNRMRDEGQLVEDMTMATTSGVPSHPLLYRIPLKFVVYANGAGQFSATEAQIQEAIRFANQNFRRNKSPFRFYLKCGIVFSNCVTCGNNPDLITLSSMFLVESGPFITVHVLNNGDSQATLPWTPLPWNMTIRNAGTLLNETTFTHEIGHNLGLHHTHRGRDFWQSVPIYGMFFDEIDNHNSGNCFQESVSRTRTQGVLCNNSGTRKCEINGDELCDTDASPNLSGLTNPGRFDFFNCNYLWNQTDNWNQAWVPPGRNYMGYTGSCRNHFTIGQTARMVNYKPSFAENHSNYSISLTSGTGNNVICPGSNITLSIPAQVGGTMFHWHVPPGWTLISPSLNPTFHENWTIYSGSQARTITLQAPSSSVMGGVQEYLIGVNPTGCNIKPADIQMVVANLILTPELQEYYCTNNQYTIYSTLDANYSLSNPSWQIVSGQGTSTPVIQVGTGSCNISATFVCGSNGARQIIQTASITMNATNTPPCGNGLQSSKQLVESYYPNPSEGFVVLNMKDCIPVEIAVIDKANQVVGTIKGESDQFTVDLPGQKGIYVIKVSSGNHVQIVKVFR